MNRRFSIYVPIRRRIPKIARIDLYEFKTVPRRAVGESFGFICYLSNFLPWVLIFLSHHYILSKSHDYLTYHFFGPRRSFAHLLFPW